MTAERIQAARAALHSALRAGTDTGPHRRAIAKLEAELEAVAQAESAELQADRQRTEEAIHADAARLAAESGARARAMLETLQLESPF